MGWSFISSRADFNFEQVRGGGAQSVVRPFGWVHRNLRGTQNLLGLGGTMGGKPFPDRGGGGQHNISRFFLLSPHLFLSRNPKGIFPDASFAFPDCKGISLFFSFLLRYTTQHTMPRPPPPVQPTNLPSLSPLSFQASYFSAPSPPSRYGFHPNVQTFDGCCLPHLFTD